MRRLNDLLTVAADVAVTKVVGKDENDVRRPRIGIGGG
jgi:hypothetical protein